MEGNQPADTTGYRNNRVTTDIPKAEVGSAFITYAFLLFVRVSGLAGLFRYQNPGNPLASPPIRAVGEFIFFDFILLAVVGLICSGIMLGLSVGNISYDEFRGVKLIASAGVGLPAITYLIGSILVVII